MVSQKPTSAISLALALKHIFYASSLLSSKQSPAAIRRPVESTEAGSFPYTPQTASIDEEVGFLCCYYLSYFVVDSYVL